MGIPVKTHRKAMKSYEDCFRASAGVDWIHDYLKSHPYFSEKCQVSRFQAVQLLRKFESANLIEKVAGKTTLKSLIIGQENEDPLDLKAMKRARFQDNSDLYKFTVQAQENLPLNQATPYLQRKKHEILKG